MRSRCSAYHSGPGSSETSERLGPNERLLVSWVRRRRRSIARLRAISRIQTFKCTGSASEALKPASTGEDTAVLTADFCRAGDGIDESFTANMIVSADDIALDIPGIQNVWVQGVG
jgi:hypothetical protein